MRKLLLLAVITLSFFGTHVSYLWIYLQQSVGHGSVLLGFFLLLQLEGVVSNVGNGVPRALGHPGQLSLQIRKLVLNLRPLGAVPVFINTQK